MAGKKDMAPARPLVAEAADSQIDQQLSHAMSGLMRQRAASVLLLQQHLWQHVGASCSSVGLTRPLSSAAETAFSFFSHIPEAPGDPILVRRTA